jgi:SAM-dependent MidA family methyltransferase
MHNTADSLPNPSTDQLAVSEPLVRHIRAQIEAAGGAIAFSQFMELALYTPDLGYYSSGQRIFAAGDVQGRTSPGARGTSVCAAGDFVTAPELGDVFARCLARQCRELLVGLGQADILEAGAGSGAFAADLLIELERLGTLPTRYFILELSAELHARQQATLQARAPALAQHVQWIDRLPAPGFHGIVLANELLDAMPVERFRVTANGVVRLGVAFDSASFVWRDMPAPAHLVERVQALGLPAGYCSEVNFAAEAWVRSLGELLGQGVLLLVDYGFPRREFYHPQRSGGTLMCHYRQRAHGDPLILVGLQDITAHVDFTAIADAGAAAGLELLGYTSQAAFLAACGLEEIVAQSDPDDARAHLALTAQIKRLTLPSEMGELFKVIALGRGIDWPLRGFWLQDRRGRL